MMIEPRTYIVEAPAIADILGMVAEAQADHEAATAQRMAREGATDADINAERDALRAAHKITMLRIALELAQLDLPAGVTIAKAEVRMPLQPCQEPALEAMDVMGVA
jgi:hypothetical protein